MSDTSHSSVPEVWAVQVAPNGEVKRVPSGPLTTNWLSCHAAPVRNTVVPEVRRDTRSGIRLTTNYQGRAGVELSAGMSVGGDNIAGSVHLGPNLTIPKQAKAGQFYPLVGDFDFGGNLDPPNLPQIDAGIDIILEGTADGTLEVGLYPLAGYQIGEFDFNLPTFRLPVFDFNFPNFQFLCLPEPWLEENPALANTSSAQGQESSIE